MPRIANITEIANPFDPAEEGNYSLSVEQAEDTMSNAGAEMLKIRLRIEAAEDAENEQHIGKTFFDYVVYGGDSPSNFSLFRMRQYAEAAGVDPTDFEAEELNGAQFDGQVKVRPATDEYPASNQLGRLFVDV